MPSVVNPVTYEPLPILASLDGSTDLQAEGTVERSFRATLAGSTQLQATLSAELSGAAVLEGSTALQATGRLNNEANVFGAAVLAGGTQLQASGASVLWSGAVFLEGSTRLEATATVEKASLPSFAFIVDVHNPAATAALAANVRRFSVRLKVNGAPVPIKGATLNAPADTLGTELSVDLARPVVAQIPLDASVDFELGIWSAALGGFAWETLLAGGRLAGRSKRIVNANNLPTDTVTVSFVDLVGDRWNLRPAANTLYFDPDKVDRPAASGASGGSTFAVRDADGAPVETVEVASPDLDLFEVLRLAYVEGCGFDEVKTNVENFPVEQVSFTLSGGFDAGVRPLLQPFSPVVFPVGNVLWILDADAPVPAGLTLRALAVNRLVEITSTLPNREPVDGLLATIKVDAVSGEYFTERLETPDPVESGTYGAKDFTSTRTERRVREYRTADAPAVIRREEVASLKTTVEDFEGNIISRETQTEQFDGLNRKTGHRRTIEQRLPDLNDVQTQTVTFTDKDGSQVVKSVKIPVTKLQEVSRETQSIFYGTHPLKPSLDTILRVETHTDGLILIDYDNTYLQRPFRSAYTEANRSGLIDSDAKQSTEFGAIRSRFEFLRVRGQSVEMETRDVNHISNAPDRANVTTRPGAAELDRKSQATQTILLTLEGSDSRRRVAEFDASGLPSSTGLDLARRYLRRLANPPLDFAAVLAFPDRSLRRGTLLTVTERGGAPLGTYIALGYKFDFALNDAGALAISSSLTARQLTASE